MILSKRCIYGIQAAIYVAAQTAAECAYPAPAQYIQIAQIATKLNISFHLLTKVLQRFTQAGIMSSYRGPHGGVLLARKAEEITLYDLITVIDTNSVFTSCILGLPGCGKDDPCPAHESWVQVRAKFNTIATSTTLAMLAANADQLNKRIAEMERIAHERSGATEEKEALAT
jgi:Rrf2 family transcriptional regulator, iron-sulfur cluster assembly transcription factor